MDTGSDQRRSTRPTRRKRTDGPLWSALSAAFLVGVTLVSVIDAASDVPIEHTPVRLIPQAENQTVLFVAPGLEHTLLELPESPTLHPAWEPLPDLRTPYWLALSDRAKMPPVPAGWDEADPIDDGDWRWVHLTPSEERSTPDRLDLLDRMRTAQVFFRGTDGTVTPCNQWRFGRWGCGLEPWIWVGPSEQVFRGQARPCIWAHPRPDSDLIIRFPDIPAGRRLSGRLGLADSAMAMETGASVSLLVRAGDAQDEFSVPNRPGMQSYQVRIPDGFDGHEVDVEFSVRTENAAMRHFCFSAAMSGLREGPSRHPATLPSEGTGLGDEP